MSILTGDVQARLAAGAIGRKGANRLWFAAPHVAQVLFGHGRDLINVMIPGRALLDRILVAVPGSELAHQMHELVKLGRPPADILAESQLFEQLVQVVRTIAARHPLLLMLDDLQWADSATTGLLFHLGRALDGARVLIVGAYRAEEIALGRKGERHPMIKS